MLHVLCSLLLLLPQGRRPILQPQDPEGRSSSGGFGRSSFRWRGMKLHLNQRPHLFLVLIYCPERRSVNAVAKRLIEAHKQAFLDPLPGFDVSVVDKAIALGKEWLGKDHPVVRCLSLGVAIHHAALPRPFLREIDVLIREKHIPIIVASPTLARGLNISASCVLFQSCQRFDHSKQMRLPISQEEFSNVSGRAGRAYVDLDGQAIGVCFTGDQLKDWKELVAQQTKRNLESGLIELMGPLLQGLKRKLDGGDIEDIID